MTVVMSSLQQRTAMRIDPSIPRYTRVEVRVGPIIREVTRIEVVDQTVEVEDNMGTIDPDKTIETITFIKHQRVWKTK